MCSMCVAWAPFPRTLRESSNSRGVQRQAAEPLTCANARGNCRNASQQCAALGCAARGIERRSESPPTTLSQADFCSQTARFSSPQRMSASNSPLRSAFHVLRARTSLPSVRSGGDEVGSSPATSQVRCLDLNPKCHACHRFNRRPRHRSPPQFDGCTQHPLLPPSSLRPRGLVWARAREHGLFFRGQFPSSRDQ